MTPMLPAPAASTDASSTLTWAGFCLAAFASGSVPFGLIFAKAKGVDLRAVGSGNIGASNVGRSMGRRWGVLVYVLDAAKGALPVLAAGWVMGTLGVAPERLHAGALWWWLAVAIMAVLGHMYSPLAGFRGGKGVATGSGALMAMWPVLTLPVLVGVVGWTLALVVARMMSVAGMVAGITIPIALVAMALARAPQGATPAEALRPVLPALIATIGIAALVIWRHRSNLARIRAGTEPRVNIVRREATPAPSGSTQAE